MNKIHFITPAPVFLCQKFMQPVAFAYYISIYILAKSSLGKGQYQGLTAAFRFVVFLYLQCLWYLGL